MNTEIKTALGYLLLVITAFLTSIKFVSALSDFMTYAHISPVDICLTLLLSGAVLYQGLKRRSDMKSIEMELCKLEERITQDYTKLIDEKIDKLTLILSQTSREVIEIKGFLNTINQNILDLAKAGSHR